MSQKNHILDHVTTLLDEGGEAAFTMAALADRSGLSRATLYRRHGGRAALLERLAAERGVTVAELDQPDVRTRILQATRQVIGEVGLSGMTVADIAAAAGVGPATVYRHFGSREELLKAFVQWSRPVAAIRDLQRDMQQPLPQALYRFAVSALRSMSEQRPLLRILMTENPETIAWLQDVRTAPERTQIQLTAFMKSQIAAGRLRPADPAKLAVAFIGTLFSFSVINPFYNGSPSDDLDIEATAAFVTDLFLQGAAAAATAPPPAEV